MAGGYVLTLLREVTGRGKQHIGRQATDSAGNFGHIQSVVVENWAESGLSGTTTNNAGTLAVNPAPGTPVDASGVPASAPSGNPLSTLAASTTREGYWFFKNLSQNTLSLVLDDGQGNALSVVPMGPAPAGSIEGASTGSADMGPHLGRIRVYGAASSQHVLRAQ